MAYHGVRNWPPVWTWVNGPDDKQPTGEMGTLRMVLVAKTRPTDRCFLLIRDEECYYLGCLLFDDHAFCRQITNLLRKHCNRAVLEIGDLDLSHTL